MKENGLLGSLEIRRITPYDTGNYSCVPSYALPDWAQVHIVHGKNIFKMEKLLKIQKFIEALLCIWYQYMFILSDEKQNGVIDGVSEVKIDASAAKKRGPEVSSSASAFLGHKKFFLVFTSIFFSTFS